MPNLTLASLCTATHSRPPPTRRPRNTPQSHESLLKRVLKEKQAPRPISPVVDFYNSVSIEQVVTAGAFDIDELEKQREVPLTLPPAKVDAKEILYAQGSTVLTRHLAWRQSAQALVTQASRNVVFVSEVLHVDDPGAPSELARAVAASLQKGLEDFFHVSSRVEFIGKSLGKLEVDL
ncbi:uncharacterized protein PG998_006311 [Apiospora kogelbergensis]|uniref:uncharacterized protein n=1 Tax=Apiospora kogelbergensis TaxID=1337665 RepID=UPI00312D5498